MNKIEISNLKYKDLIYYCRYEPANPDGHFHNGYYYHEIGKFLCYKKDENKIVIELVSPYKNTVCFPNIIDIPESEVTLVTKENVEGLFENSLKNLNNTLLKLQEEREQDNSYYEQVRISQDLFDINQQIESTNDIKEYLKNSLKGEI